MIAFLQFSRTLKLSTLLTWVPVEHRKLGTPKFLIPGVPVKDSAAAWMMHAVALSDGAQPS